MKPERFDVVVVGGGTAGANAAYQFARRGRRVLLVERRAPDLGGAQWHNGVLDRQFVEADLEPPSGVERYAEGGTVHLRARDPKLGPAMRNAPTVSAHMGHLGRRLRALAIDAGAEFVSNLQRLDLDLDRFGRPSMLRLHGADGTARRVSAALIVDASGRHGVIRRQIPDLAPWCPPVRGDELCSASDVHHDVTDPAGAQRFLDRHGAAPGETVTQVGVDGGFSTRAITVSADLTSAGVLVGSLANGRYPLGPRMLAETRRTNPWLGAGHDAGTGAIPLRRPYARITAPGVALVGDAACQVFPAHGSGIGFGLIAGSMLAAGVGDLDDPGDPHDLWSNYQARFQHRYGGTLLAFDVLRRLSTAIDSAGVDRMMRAGLMTETTLRSGLEQRWAPPPPAEGARSAARLARNPGLARMLGPRLVRAQLLADHGARHPERYDLNALERWDARAERLLGEIPA